LFPHVPQLRRSVFVSVQMPLHDVRPPPHTHLAPMQLAPLLHTLPHAPQSNGSVVRSTHAFAQSVRPGPHVAVHTPSEQTWLGPHLIPQPPQLSGSLFVSVQTPEQRVPPL